MTDPYQYRVKSSGFNLVSAIFARSIHHIPQAFQINKASFKHQARPILTTTVPRTSVVITATKVFSLVTRNFHVITRCCWSHQPIDTLLALMMLMLELFHTLVYGVASCRFRSMTATSTLHVLPYHLKSSAQSKKFCYLCTTNWGYHA